MAGDTLMLGGINGDPRVTWFTVGYVSSKTVLSVWIEFSFDRLTFDL